MKDILQDRYREKLVTAEQIANMIKSGGKVFIGEFAIRPEKLDEALARRASELRDVIVEGLSVLTVPKFIEADPERKAFIYNDWHFSASARKLYQAGLCSYIPFSYHQAPRIIRKYNNYDFIFISARPMDDQGYFNFGIANSITSSIIPKAAKVVVEVNSKIPRCMGGNQESVHISRVDYIIEGPNSPLTQLPPAKPTETDYQIAGHIMKEIEDGACLQLGIGGLPNVIGTMLAESDVKDLGVHTEMLVDSMVDLYNVGKITGAKKTIDRFKMVYTFAMGTNKLYEFLHNNSACASYPVDYTNDPWVVCLNNKVVSINSAIEVDLFSQVCSESAGTTHISGTGGQLDFVLGAFKSRGGKGIIAISSTYTDKNGEMKSRIVPTLQQGAIVTCPRSMTQYVATEFGIVQLKGKSTWERAEALISIAHPKFQDELIREAEKMKIWVKKNR